MSAIGSWGLRLPHRSVTETTARDQSIDAQRISANTKPNIGKCSITIKAKPAWMSQKRVTVHFNLCFLQNMWNYVLSTKFFGRRGKDEGEIKCYFPAETGMQSSSQAATSLVTWLGWWETPSPAVAITKQIAAPGGMWWGWRGRTQDRNGWRWGGWAGGGSWQAATPETGRKAPSISPISSRRENERCCIVLGELLQDQKINDSPWRATATANKSKGSSQDWKSQWSTYVFHTGGVCNRYIPITILF